MTNVGESLKDHADRESLKDRAERIRKAGLAVMGDHTFTELKEIWRRLPNATAKPPQSQRALAEAVALQLDDLGDAAPKDLKAFIAEAQPLREFGGTVDVTVTVKPKMTMKNKTEGNPGIEATGRTDENASTSTNQASEDTTMQAQTHASGSKKQRPKSPGSSGVKAKAGRTSGGKAKSARAAGGSAKQAAKSPGRKPATGPREGTMISIVVKLTKEGKGREAIGNAIAKAFPKSTFAEEVKGEDYHAVAWYQNQARKRGWLPKLN